LIHGTAARLACRHHLHDAFAESTLGNDDDQLHFDRRTARKRHNPDDCPASDFFVSDFTLKIGRSKIGQTGMRGEFQFGGDINRRAENTRQASSSLITNAAIKVVTRL